MTTILGHCRHCDSPIFERIGATCTHRGYLIWTAATKFCQLREGAYTYEASMTLEFPQETDHKAADIADAVISAILNSPL